MQIMTYQKQLGAKGEQIASDFLESKGYRIIDQNFSSRFGELDLVALDGEDLVFVEVKTRTNLAFGFPESSITPAKVEKIQNTGLIWLQDHPETTGDWRIDIIAILLNTHQEIEDIQHFVNI